jgi:hypothetical protein
MKKVMFLLLFPVLGVLLLAGVGVTSAGAATADDCQAKINALVTQTESAQFFGGQADYNRADLLGKLNEASTKLAAGKYEDAIQKLTDFRTSVVQLSSAAKPKIDLDAAAALIAGADDAIACIQSLLPAPTSEAPTPAPTTSEAPTPAPTSTDTATAAPTSTDTATATP